MKIVLTLLVRDEEDVLDAQLAYHLSVGVDLVVAIDHDSQDGTAEIMARYARAGYLRRIVERGALREAQWRTRLARLAAAEHGADWVLNGDADMFFLPQGGDLREVLAAVPTRYGALLAVDRVFVPRPDGGGHFAERMTVRLAAPAAINSPTSAYRPLPRLLHRGSPVIRVSSGGHSLGDASLRLLPTWHPVEVLHFPWRSPEQLARKARHQWQAHVDGRAALTGHHWAAHRAASAGGAEAHYRRLALDDREVERGLATGMLVHDVRLRDALRSLAAASPIPEGWVPELALLDRTPRRGGSERQATDGAAHAAELVALGEAQLVRARRRLDALDSRLAALERRQRR